MGEGEDLTNFDTAQHSNGLFSWQNGRRGGRAFISVSNVPQCACACFETYRLENVYWEANDTNRHSSEDRKINFHIETVLSVDCRRGRRTGQRRPGLMIGGGSETIKNISCSPTLAHCILIQPATITLGHGGSVVLGWSSVCTIIKRWPLIIFPIWGNCINLTSNPATRNPPLHATLYLITPTTAPPRIYCH